MALLGYLSGQRFSFVRRDPEAAACLVLPKPPAGAEEATDA